MKWFDDWFERSARRVACSTSRRSALARVGKALLAGSVVALPVLPFDRSGGKAHAAAGGGGGSADPGERLIRGRCDLPAEPGVSGLKVSRGVGPHPARRSFPARPIPNSESRLGGEAVVGRDCYRCLTSV